MTSNYESFDVTVYFAEITNLTSFLSILTGQGRVALQKKQFVFKFWASCCTFAAKVVVYP